MKIFLTILFVLFSLTVYSEDGYCVFVGTFDINEAETLQLILDIKKIAPKEDSVKIKDTKTDLLKTVFVDNFKSEKEAVLFNEKIRADYKKHTNFSYVTTTSLQEKIMQNSIASKYNLLTVKSKSNLPKGIIKNLFPELIIEKSTANEISMVLQVYEKGSKQDALLGVSAVFNKIYSYLNDSQYVDFTIEVKPILQNESEIALVITSSQDLPMEELKEKFRSFVIENKNVKNEVWLSMTNDHNELGLNAFQRVSNRIKEYSDIMMQSKINEFRFTLQEINKKEVDITNNKGSTIEKESAIDLALKWLADHQEQDGHWDSGKYEGSGIPEADCAVTGITLLAFLGAGHTDRSGKYREVVSKAIKWLISAQRPNGSWDNKNYANAICTMALAEACGMGCGGKELKKYAEKAVDYLLKQQNKSGCFDYTGPSNRDDMTVTGWCIMGLKSALLAGLKDKN